MRSPLSVVDLVSGLVSECPPDAVSLDVPASLDTGAEAKLDGIGFLHFGQSNGRAAIERPHPLPLSSRGLDEPFLVDTGPAAADENGWRLYRLSIREP
jgi:hypothetical protein